MDLGITYRRDFGRGTWWPDYDHAPEKCYTTVQRGLRALYPSAKAATRRGCVVQAGGHAGIWPIELSPYFDRVITLEPDPALFACLERNCAGYAEIEKLPYALSDVTGDAILGFRASAGSARLEESANPDKSVAVQTVTIDHLQLKDVGGIFLDIEGGERRALTGAQETIARDRPVIHVELLKQHEDEIHAYIVSLGYARKHRIGRDALYLPK